MTGPRASETDAVLDYLVERLAPDLELRRFAELLDTLCWSNDDNGHEIELTRRRWLNTGDRRRATVAVLMENVFPGGSRAELVANLGAASGRFPELRGAADAIIETWDRQQPEPVESAAAAPEAEQPAGPEAGTGMSVPRALDFLADHPAPNMPPKYLSEILDDLAGCLDEAGVRELFAVRAAWSHGADEWRAAVAAEMESDAPHG